jgi:hypothetical protein
MAGIHLLMLGAFATGAAPGQQAYTTPGTYSWLCPAGVTSVCVVAVGGGAVGINYTGGGGGGGLGWKNDISVVPGTSYTVVVGVGGTFPPNPSLAGGMSYFISSATVSGGGGVYSGAGGTYVGDGGGNGGARTSGGCCYMPASGGAGGYSGNGGNGGSAGSGGGGAGGDPYTTNPSSTRGGGVGILGEGASGTYPSGAGSGGVGALYGGGHPYQDEDATPYPGCGAVRIIWGAGRAFPSTNTGDV